MYVCGSCCGHEQHEFFGITELEGKLCNSFCRFISPGHREIDVGRVVQELPPIRTFRLSNVPWVHLSLWVIEKWLISMIFVFVTTRIYEDKSLHAKLNLRETEWSSTMSSFLKNRGRMLPWWCGYMRTHLLAFHFEIVHTFYRLRKAIIKTHF